jgi:hypothetical protein
MVQAAAVAHAVHVPRLLIVWSRPHHLTREETSRWVHGEVGTLLDGAGTRSGELRRLESASPRHGCDWHWLLDLDVAAPASTFVDEGAGAQWLADLRLLGMRPQVMVVGDAVTCERKSAR